MIFSILVLRTPYIGNKALIVVGCDAMLRVRVRGCLISLTTCLNGTKFFNEFKDIVDSLLTARA